MLPSRLFYTVLVGGVALALSPAASLRVAAQATADHNDLVLKLQLCRSVKNRAFRLSCFERIAASADADGRPAASSSIDPDTATHAASEEMVVPLPPPSPERTDFAGLLDGELPNDAGPGANSQDVAEAVITDLTTPADLTTASLGDASVTPKMTNNWSVSGWTSPLSGVRDMTITRAADRTDDGPVALLSFTCSNDSGAVQVVWPRGMNTREAKAALVIDGEAEEAATWSISADGRTMSIEGRDSALAAARKAAAAETLSVRIVDDLAHQWDVTFGTDGLDSHLEEFKAACSG